MPENIDYIKELTSTTAVGPQHLKVVVHAHPKSIETILSFTEFVPACNESVYYICSLLRYNFRVP